MSSINTNSINYEDIIKYKQIPSFDEESASTINENKIKIIDIKNNLIEYEKNPNFYRNKKIIAITAAVVATIAVAVLAYFCWVVALPVFLGEIGTGRASGAAIGGGIFMPAVAGLGGYLGVSYLFKSLDGDKEALKKLETENNVLTNRLQSKIKLCNAHIESSNAATTKQFTEEAWKAMKAISTSAYSTLLDHIDTDQKKEALWLVNQQEIISFRNKNELARQKLQAVL